MEKVQIGVLRLAGAEDLALPSYMSDGAAGMDLCAAVPSPVVVPPGRTAFIPTGLAVAIPPGYEGQVRARSGLALKHGLFVLNSPGTIDSDYRGEIGVVVANFGPEPFRVERGDRIAQLVIASVARAVWVEGPALSPTARHEGGFGHTGGTGPTRR
jgi:dUTP pyrophosphatase